MNLNPQLAKHVPLANPLLAGQIPKLNQAVIFQCLSSAQQLMARRRAGTSTPATGPFR
jgi:hypothetical protein